NVIMRGADDRDLSVEAQLLGGSHGRVDGNLSASGTRGPLSWLVSGGRRFSELAPGRAEDRGARSERLDGLATLRWAPDESRSVELSVNAQDQAQRWRTGQLYFFGDDQHVSGRLSGTLHAGAHTFRPTLYASSFDHLSRRSSTAEPATAGDNDRQSVGELELLYGFTAGVHAIDAGVEVRRDETLSDRLQDHERLLT